MKSSPSCDKCAVKIHENGAFLVERIFLSFLGSFSPKNGEKIVKIIFLLIIKIIIKILKIVIKK